MKKNLNIAYLNGAEGMIIRGGASSGGNSGESESGNEVKWEYYKVVNFSEIPYETLYPASTYANFGDRIDNTSLAYSDNVQRELIKSVAGTNIPLIYIDTMETFIVDKGSWKLNVIEFYGIDENKFNEHFIPITKEQFYSLE